MANLPFSLSGIDPAQYGLTQEELDALAYVWGGQSGSLMGDAMNSGNPYTMMSAYYGDMPYYKGGNGSSGGKTSASQQLYGSKPGTGGYYQNITGVRSGGGGGGGNGGNGSGGTVTPPVTVPGVNSGTLPGVNGSVAFSEPTLMTPPPVGSGMNWRNTMKYGA